MWQQPLGNHFSAHPSCFIEIQKQVLSIVRLKIILQCQASLVFSEPKINFVFYLETQHQLNFELQNRYADNSLLEIISQPTPQIPSSSFIEIQKQVPIYIFEDKVTIYIFEYWLLGLKKSWPRNSLQFLSWIRRLLASSNAYLCYLLL